MRISRFRLSERQVLLLILVAFFLTYAGTFLLVAMRQKVQRTPTVKRPTVRWMPPPDAARAREIHYVMADLLDPSLMSLPNAHGFSRPMWQHQISATHRALEPADDLAFLESDSPGNFQPLLNQPSPADFVRAAVGNPPVPPEPATGPEPGPTPSLFNQSVFRTSGLLARRAVVRRPALPVIPSDATLRPTVVRVAVAADGVVPYAMLQRSCGNETVDAQALDWARQIRFELTNAVAPRALTWGRVQFLWATAAPPSTNGTAAAPQ